MPVQPIPTPIGHSLPPHEHHTITLHAPTWDHAIRFRNKDASLFAQMVSMYPRFAPWNQASALCKAIHSRLSLPEDSGCLPFVHPEIFSAAVEYAFSHHRGANEKEGTKLIPDELRFRVVDVGQVRLFVLVFPGKKGPGIMGLWQNHGTGISTRLAEDLLKVIEEDTTDQAEFKVVDFEATGENLVEVFEQGKIPEATWLPEVEAHSLLRERIAGLMRRDSLAPERAEKFKAEDVFLYGTGMAGIYYLHNVLIGKTGDVLADQEEAKRRQGTILVIGSVFHNTWHVFEEEAPAGGFKHFGKCETSQDLDEIEAWLEKSAQQGGRISYLFVEFPSNPLLVSVDLERLRGWADKYNFPVVVDDTVGSFCNVDLLPVADVIVSSLTKSFSGYANVMAGSVVLNPSHPFYSTFLKPAFIASYKNELYSSDAVRLLSNSDDYLARSKILNRNAQAIADLAASYSSSSAATSNNSNKTIVKSVLYPTYSPTLANYQKFLRQQTTKPSTSNKEEKEPFEPGHGCLLSIEFIDRQTAISFYDNLHVHKGPHLGAHLTLAMPYNEMVWGNEDIVQEGYHIAYGMTLEQVRVSVGLEEEQELVGVFRHAFEAALSS